MKATLNQYCHGKNAEVRQHKHTASLCHPAKPPLWIYMHDAGFLKWIYLKLQGSLKAGAVIFSSPPRSGAGFIGGAMNLASCDRGTFWWWIHIGVPEIALWFGVCLMGLFSRCSNEGAAVGLRAVTLGTSLKDKFAGFPLVLICNSTGAGDATISLQHYTETVDVLTWTVFHSSVWWPTLSLRDLWV